METDIRVCSLCLGDSTDVPSFGSMADAADLIKPCTTCSLVVHRKCLVDWFNSLPANKLKSIDSRTLEDTASSIFNNGDEAGVQEGQGEENGDGSIDITISPLSIHNWLTRLFSRITSTYSPEDLQHESADDSGSFMVFIAQCPQCRSNILFRLKRSTVLDAASTIKSFTIRTVQISSLLGGITCEIVGVVTVFYVGLTTCSLKMLRWMVPTPILVKMLAVNGPLSFRQKSILNKILIGNSDDPDVSSLDSAFLNGLIDPLKFSRVPVLPIALYQLRSSSLASCIFSNSKEFSANNWITEIMVNTYISSLGNHELVMSLGSNIKNLLRSNLKSLNGQWNILKGVDLLKPSILISLLIPARWAYDIFYRMTFNRMYFKMAKRVKPREIANRMRQEDLDELEMVDDHLYEASVKLNKTMNEIYNEVDAEIRNKKMLPIIAKFYSSLKKRSKVLQALVNPERLSLYLRSYVKKFIIESEACLKNDYSEVLLSKSIIVKSITTIGWSLLSSKIGVIINKFLASNLLVHVPHDRSTFLCNIIGMFVVVFFKDCVNLGLAKAKANQLANIDFLVRWPV